jgi:hypothetical protein
MHKEQKESKMDTPQLFNRPEASSTTMQGNRVKTKAKFSNGVHAPSSVQVVWYEATGKPDNQTLRTLWRNRFAGKPITGVVCALHGEGRVSLCGAAGDQPPVYTDKDRGQVERICMAVLDAADRFQAIRVFGNSIEALSSEMAGVRNEGFLSGHELQNRVPQRGDWKQACERGKGLLKLQGMDLLGQLGYTFERCDNQTTILKSRERKVGMAVLLEQSESPDGASLRFAGISPVSYALAKADAENLPYVITVTGTTLRIYPTSLAVGVGRRGRTETFVEVRADLLADDKAGYLWLLLSGEALEPEGSLEQILEESNRYAGSLADDLRERIYDKVLPELAASVVGSLALEEPDADDLKHIYEAALVILYRMLFIAYAEDKDLLPYRHNGLYQRRSLKSIAGEVLEGVRSEAQYGEGTTLWDSVKALFHAVDRGKSEWSVPRYNGGLFNPETEVGKTIESLSMEDARFSVVLENLLLAKQNGDMLGPVDFASLGVREFGTIYEGLLESELSVAPQDLALNKESQYVPAKGTARVAVRKGEVYLHNASGQRKSTGSYYTKHFAVEHLLEKALVPALREHFERLDKLDETDAADSFFDFRTADISMGSGHFQVAAIDTIEREMSNYLAKRNLRGVSGEIQSLREAARLSLGDIADQIGEIEDSQILRRIIARRCIYGVDINPISVQLARLAVWIHTFVPGLPLSLLDRNLVCGNSLIGVGTVKEIRERFDRIYSSGDSAYEEMFRFDTDTLLADASQSLDRLATISDGTYADIQRQKEAAKDAAAATAPAKALCDIITAIPLIGADPNEEDTIETRRADTQLRDFNFTKPWDRMRQSIVDSDAHARAKQIISKLNVLHFPITFPEVFLRGRDGFDVILGNPPWEKVKVEEKTFWTRYRPGIKGVSQREYERERETLIEERPDLAEQLAVERKQADILVKVLANASSAGVSSGDPDLYKAFTWRFWNLVRAQSGRIGVVLPRSAMAGDGSKGFRKAMFASGAGVECCMMVNNRHWIFDDVHQQYTASLLAVSKGASESGRIHLEGPYRSPAEYKQGVRRGGEVLTPEQITEWNPGMVFPLLPTPKSLPIFLKLREHPDLAADIEGEWKVKPYCELHATNDKELMDFVSQDCPEGFWPVLKGASYNLWEPDTGETYAWADPEEVVPVLQGKRLNTYQRPKSPFYGITEEEARNSQTLPCYRPRIAFRDVTNRTNTRTFVTALLPPKCFMVHTSPCLVRTRGDEADEAYLIGVLSSIPFDWYARRFIELHATFALVNHFPVPRPEEKHSLRQRIVELAGRLACPDDRFADWAKAVGVEHGPVNKETKEAMIGELDAVVALLYGLNQSQLKHIFETFHAGWDYRKRLERTLGYFRIWKGGSN